MVLDCVSVRIAHSPPYWLPRGERPKVSPARLGICRDELAVTPAWETKIGLVTCAIHTGLLKAPVSYSRKMSLICCQVKYKMAAARPLWKPQGLKTLNLPRTGSWLSTA